MRTKDNEVVEAYTPPSMTVLGSLSADTLKEVVDTVYDRKTS